MPVSSGSFMPPLCPYLLHLLPLWSGQPSGLVLALEGVDLGADRGDVFLARLAQLADAHTLPVCLVLLDLLRPLSLAKGVHGIRPRLFLPHDASWCEVPPPQTAPRDLVLRGPRSGECDGIGSDACVTLERGALNRERCPPADE